MVEINYSSWPLGHLPEEWQRPELNKLKELGYILDDPRDAVSIFEWKVARFAGSKYGVSIDCCSHGLFLALKYNLITDPDIKKSPVIIPSRTYASVPMQISNVPLTYQFEDVEWSGLYPLKGTRVWDGAVRWTKDMYVGGNALQVVSFQLKKRVPIGKGGMILTDDEDAYKWLKLASYDGRDLSTPYTDKDHIKMLGYHMYMTPEDAARGIILMSQVPKVNPDSGDHTKYSDLSKMDIFRS